MFVKNDHIDVCSRPKWVNRSFEGNGTKVAVPLDFGVVSRWKQLIFGVFRIIGELRAEYYSSVTGRKCCVRGSLGNCSRI